MAQLTPEELVQVNTLNNRYAKIFMEIGQAVVKKKDYQKMLSDIVREEEALHNDYQLVLEEEVVVVRALNEKYGEGSLDLVTGVITP